MDTLRTLIRANQDFSRTDIERFINLYCGTPEGLELLLKQWCTQWGMDDDRSIEALALATAVSEYGRGILEWDYFIRKLLRSGTNIHGNAPELFMVHFDGGDGVSHVWQSPRRTPLHELLIYTATPLEAQTAGDAWLDLLTSEGCDVKAYLDRERSEHEAEEQLILCHPLRHAFIRTHELCCIPRTLTIQIEGTPRVSWEWQFDPGSPLDLLHREFRLLLMSLRQGWNVDSRSWPHNWPFDGPTWIFNYHATNSSVWDEGRWNEVESLAEKREHRRAKKKASKARRALSSKLSVKMPGAWPV